MQKVNTNVERLAESAIPQFQHDLELIDLLIRNHHTEHCAKRIVWGDGYCECGRDRTGKNYAR